MPDYEPFLSLGLAAAAGLLIGLERERSAPADRRAESFLGGARTHPMFALVGGVSMLAARQLGAVAVVLPMAALVLLLVVSYAGDVLRDRDRGITSEAALLLSYLLGVLSLSEGVIEPLSHKIFVVAAVAVVATFLLSSKPTLHPFVRAVTTEDVTATLKFLVVAVVILPLLPDRNVGPYDVWNPFQVGMLVVLISGVSFLGYAGIRLLGPHRGLGLTGLVGGVVSSTAVTLSMSARARERPEIADAAALAVTLASTVMFVRIFALVAFVNPSLEGQLVYPIAAATLAGLAAAALLFGRSRRSSAEGGAIAVANPFELSRAVQFALLFAVVLLGSKAAAVHLGAAGTYAAGVIGGTADVDAIALSMAKLAGGGTIADRVAATTIFLAAASNTLVKGVLAAVLGGWAFGRRVMAAQLAMLAGGALGVAATWLL
jgi:uncharacterized membrane protein (DUF4010 family)